MPSNFNWQAEDDRFWDEFKDPKAPKAPKPPKRRVRLRFFVAILGILVITATGILIYRQARKFIAQAETSVETDILTSQDLVLHAVNVGDPEVLVSVLSGREDDWTSAMVSLLDSGLFYDRAQYGLEWDRSFAPADVDVSMAPDLRSAELQFSLTYSQSAGVESASDQVGRVELVQTAVFRVSSDRWLLAPPLEDFWGETISAEGRYVTVDFPSRDADLGRRLAADLEAALGSVCNSLGEISCPDSYRLNVILSPDPSILIDSINPAAQYEDGNELFLPTPTLMGVPNDESGYRAIQRAFTLMAARRLLNQLNPWECCDQAVFYEALSAAQLTSLDLQDWPSSPGEYMGALRIPVSFTQLAQLWDDSQSLENSPDQGENWMVYALVEFLLAERISVSPIEMQNALSATGNFYEWFHRVIQMDYTSEYVEQQWNQFILQRIDAWQLDSPVPMPDQEIALICDEGIVGSSNLYIYDPKTETWSLALSNHEFVNMSSIPGGAGIMLSDQLLRPERIRTFIWRDGHEYVIDEGHRVFHLTGETDPKGLVAGLSGYDSQTYASGHYVLDLANCGPRGCPYEAVPGSLRWSPSGDKTIFVDASLSQSIRIGDDTGNFAIPVAIGRDPFWLSDESFGYIRLDSMPVVVSSTIGISETRDLFGRMDAAAIITGTNANDIVVRRATAQPYNPSRLFVLASDRTGDKIYLFSHDWKENFTTLINEAEGPLNAVSAVSFSPDGRWLLISRFVPSESSTSSQFNVTLYDLETNDVQELPPVDDNIYQSTGWSADSNWLVQLAEGKLILTALKEDYQHLVLHGLNACRGAAWTNAPLSP